MRIRQTFELFPVVWRAYIQDVSMFIEQHSFVQLCGRDHVHKRGSAFDIILNHLRQIADTRAEVLCPD